MPLARCTRPEVDQVKVLAKFATGNVGRGLRKWGVWLVLVSDLPHSAV